MPDWKPGDMAVCTVDGPWCDGAPDDFIRGPKLNEIVTVTGLDCAWFDDGSKYETLHLKEWPIHNGWQASAFRRIEPPAQSEIIRELETV